MKLSDEVFHKMLANANFKNGILKISIRGFKPISHNGIFKILKKKFGKNEGCVFDTDSCKIPLNFVQLPNDRTGLPHKFPPIKILGSSIVEGIGFTRKGESAILFVMFHMPTIIVQFMKQIPEKIENCYSTPGASSKQSLEDKLNQSSSASSDTSESSGSSQLKNVYVTPDVTPIVTPPSSSPSLQSPSGISSSLPMSFTIT